MDRIAWMKFGFDVMDGVGALVMERELLEIEEMTLEEEEKEDEDEEGEKEEEGFELLYFIRMGIGSLLILSCLWMCSIWVGRGRVSTTSGSIF